MRNTKISLQPKTLWHFAVSFILTLSLKILLTSLPVKAAFDTSTIYKIVNKNSGKVLDVANMSTADGANVQQWTSWSGGTNQEWQIVDAGSGYYKFINRNSGKALDVYNMSTADGTNLHQWSSWSGTNQQWQLVAAGSGPDSNGIYVAANGSASNPGTIDRPTTLTMALTKVAAGGTIYMLGGTYSYSSTITIARDNSGSSGGRKKIFAYGSEKPVLDFSSQSFGSANRGLQIFGHYWHVKGVRVTGAGDNGIFIGGNNNIIENVETDHNRDSGLQISRYDSSLTNMSDWPSNNLILNSYS
ncbi:RICIN domain-containing protein [Paenibacillus sp. WST5]|uniref:RICIN domain-containing protein n=1 Tax=Paenibacillus sedimenti TaxID=2770274 RepID=A0A926KVU6_9BACL|nr:RICIN domain-containing protein [Paenibacillus sedimenti]